MYNIVLVVVRHGVYGLHYAFACVCVCTCVQEIKGGEQNNTSPSKVEDRNGNMPVYGRKRGRESEKDSKIRSKEKERESTTKGTARKFWK